MLPHEYSKFSTPLGILKKPAGEFILTTSDVEGQKFLDKLYALCDDEETAKIGVTFDENDSNLELQLTYVKAFNSAITKLRTIESEYDLDELSKFVQYLIDNIFIAFDKKIRLKPVDLIQVVAMLLIKSIWFN